MTDIATAQRRLPLPRREGRLLRASEPFALRVGARRRQPHLGHGPERVPRRIRSASRLTGTDLAARVRLRAALLAGRCDRVHGNAFNGASRASCSWSATAPATTSSLLTPAPNGPDIQAAQTGIPGLTGFVDPLDLTEDRSNGNLYVTEFGASRITLLRPVQTAAAPQWRSPVAADLQRRRRRHGERREDRDHQATPASGPLSVSGLTVSGADQGAVPDHLRRRRCRRSVPAGGSLSVQVVFDPTATGPKRASLTVTGNDTTNPSDLRRAARARHARPRRRRRALAAVDPRHLRHPGQRRRPRSDQQRPVLDELADRRRGRPAADGQGRLGRRDDRAARRLRAAVERRSGDEPRLVPGIRRVPDAALQRRQPRLPVTRPAGQRHHLVRPGDGPFGSRRSGRSSRTARSSARTPGTRSPARSPTTSAPTR